MFRRDLTFWALSTSSIICGLDMWGYTCLALSEVSSDNSTDLKICVTLDVGGG